MQSLTGSVRRAVYNHRRGLATESLRRTGLYDWHLSHGAKMVPFAGFDMPLIYASLGQVASHNHTRASASLFDVGHMVQSFVRGANATAFLERLTPAGLQSLKCHSSTLSVLLNEQGGIIDDLIITRISADEFYVVTNAGRRERDLAWFQQVQKEFQGVEMEVLENHGLIALQGPKAAAVLQALTRDDLSKLTFGNSAYLSLDGVEGSVHVARAGYTGEDGFEISTSSTQTVALAEILQSSSAVEPAGLGSRDSLRLEAGMCLYGADLDEKTSAIEAGLAWVVAKSRRPIPADPTNDFIGAELTRKHIADGPPRRRVGLITSGAPARHGAKLFSVNDSTNSIGEITSGIPSPTLGVNIAMAYVPSGSHKVGTELEVEVRGRRSTAKIVKMPFVETKYWRGS